MQCPRCRRTVLPVQGRGGEQLWLDVSACTYQSLDPTHLFPDEGDAVGQSTALVDHRALCESVQRGQAVERAHQQNLATTRKTRDAAANG